MRPTSRQKPKSDGAMAQAPAPPAPPVTPSVSSSTTSDAVIRLEPTPFVAASQSGCRGDAKPQDLADEDSRPMISPNRCRRARRPDPRRLTDFPVRPQYACGRDAADRFHLRTATLVDLIERRGGLDLARGVAVIRQIACTLSDDSPQSPSTCSILGRFESPSKVEVHMLSGQPSSDPLVIQVGRLLRTMLMGKEAPPELRRLLSQATFELPIFESIEDVDRALAQIEQARRTRTRGTRAAACRGRAPDAPYPGGRVRVSTASDPLYPPDAAKTRREGTAAGLPG